jgi:hypothetical protein
MSKKRVALLFAVLALAGTVWYLFERRPAPRLAGPTLSPPALGGRSKTATPAPEVADHGKPGPATVGSGKVNVSETGPVLRSGETLNFDANVTKLNSTVANLKIVVGEKRDLAGKNVWHLQAFAHTENPYRMIFELDDQFDSYSDPADLTSHQYEMHLSERGQKVESVQRIFASTKDPAPPGATAARVLPETRDPLGFLHYLRNVDWSKTPQVHSPVYDGHKLYAVRAELISKAESVSVPAGDFQATKIEIHVFDNGTEMKDAHFFLFLANNAARTPVLVEAVLPVATARVELTQAR